MHCMLDLETFDTSANSMIASIGAVMFNKDKIHDEFYNAVKISDEDLRMFSMSASTLNWWLGQKVEAIKALTNGDRLIDVLYSFKIFFETRQGKEVWGNGSDFDNVILANAYRKLGLDQPWSYRENCCYRTIRTRFPKVDFSFEGTAHNALYDARNQANYLIKLNKELALNIL